MKKHARRLLSATLAVCIGLMVTGGTASATIAIANTSEKIQVGQKLEPKTEIASDANAGMKITYNIPAKFFSDSSSGGTDTAEINQNEPIDLIPAGLDLHDNGYQITLWRVTSVTTDPGNNQDLLTLDADEKVPISYTIEYYDSDQTTLLYRDEGITVENVNHYTIRTTAKEGHTMSHWYVPTSNSKLPPGSPISDVFISSEGSPDSGYVIKLYAVWKETPMDHSPAAGDDMPVGMLLSLMIASAAAITLYKRHSA